MEIGGLLNVSNVSNALTWAGKEGFPSGTLTRVFFDFHLPI